MSEKRNDTFIYEWHEPVKGHVISLKMILQAVGLAVVVGLGPELFMMLIGHGNDASVYQLRYMLVLIPVVLIISIISHKNGSRVDVTTSSLVIEDGVVKITRFVTAETGRRFFCEWSSLDLRQVCYDELHRVIQISAAWKVSAHKVKDKKPGAFIDSEIRDYPQTIQLAPEAYYTVIKYLQNNHNDILTEMSKDDYEAARPFIHKHYEI